MQRVIRIRYLVPTLPCIIILSIFGLYNLKSYLSTRQYQRTTTLQPALLLLAALSMNGMYMVHHWQNIRPLQYLSGQIDRTSFITSFWPEYPLIHYANSNLQRKTKVLCIFLGNRGYYMNFNPIFDRPFQGGLLTGILNSPSQRKSIKAELLRRDITHILLRNDLTQNWYQHLSEYKQAAVALFFQHDTQELFSREGYSFLRINQPIASIPEYRKHNP